MTTKPAPAEHPVTPPPAYKVSKLALAALEAGVSADDVRAHLESRGGSTSDDIARLALELLNQ